MDIKKLNARDTKAIIASAATVRIEQARAKYAALFAEVDKLAPGQSLVIRCKEDIGRVRNSVLVRARRLGRSDITTRAIDGETLAIVRIDPDAIREGLI